MARLNQCDGCELIAVRLWWASPDESGTGTMPWASCGP